MDSHSQSCPVAANDIHSPLHQAHSHVQAINRAADRHITAGQQKKQFSSQIVLPDSTPVPERSLQHGTEEGALAGFDF